MKQKLLNSQGFSLTEMITAVMILALISVSISVGLPTIINVYHHMTLHSEASVLCSTLSTSLADELRSVINITGTDDVVFDSLTSGRSLSVITDEEGHLNIGKDQPLLGDTAYTSGLKASAKVSYSNTDSLFHVHLSVTDEKDNILAESDLSIRPLNESNWKNITLPEEDSKDDSEEGTNIDAEDDTENDAGAEDEDNAEENTEQNTEQNTQ